MTKEGKRQKQMQDMAMILWEKPKQLMTTSLSGIIAALQDLYDREGDLPQFISDEGVLFPFGEDNAGSGYRVYQILGFVWRHEPIPQGDMDGEGEGSLRRRGKPAEEKE